MSNSNWGSAFFLLSTGETKMIHQQLEKLKKDSKELNDFMKKLELEGNYELIKKVMGKREYLERKIEELMERA